MISLECDVKNQCDVIGGAMQKGCDVHVAEGLMTPGMQYCRGAMG